MNTGSLFRRILQIHRTPPLAQRLRLLLATLCCAGLTGVAQAADPVAINFDANNPPYMFALDGRAAGIYPAIVSAAMEKTGVPVKLDTRPWKRALAETDAGKSGIGGVYQNSDRARRYDFSDPILTENIAVYFNTAKPITFRSLPDLYGLTVGVIRGWSYGDAFDTARQSGLIKVEEVSGDRSNFMKLAEGRLDAILSVDESGRATLAATGLGNIDQSRPYLASNKVYLAFAKSSQRKDVLDKFNRALSAMKHDGSLDRIVARGSAR